MTSQKPEPHLYERIEHAWAEELAACFDRTTEDVFQQVRPWLLFPQGLVRIELMDGSSAEFKYCVFVASEKKGAIAVFTEHCGNHVFPSHDAKVYRDGRLVWEAPRPGAPTDLLFFKVFGRLIAIREKAGSWQAFHTGSNGTLRPADFIIPTGTREEELAEYLADLFHEDATPEHNTVERLYPEAQ